MQIPKAEVASSNLAGGTRVLLDETNLGSQLSLVTVTDFGTKNFIDHIHAVMGKKMCGQKDELPISDVRSGRVALK